jgi:elongation factor Ts
MANKGLIEKVKQLREELGIGVIDIKKALEEAGEDIDKAREILAEQGLAEAGKKADRETNQGYVATYTHSNGKVGAMVELLCETDFMARNEEFRQFAQDLCLQVASMNPENVDELMEQKFVKETDKTIEEVLKLNIAKFGENIQIGDIARFAI